MSADLIGVGFTTDRTVSPSLSAIADHIRAIPDETLLSEKFLATADPQGWFDGRGDAGYIRDCLISGANEYHYAVIQGRGVAAGFPFPGSSLFFTFAGGESWGDDPFEGFHDLCVFIDAVPLLGIPVEDSGLVCGGLPDPATVQRYAVTA